MSEESVIEIDGSLLEGGGQILRIAICLSTLKRIPIRITNIRAGRSKPGLMEQHLKGIELVRNICNANANGLNMGSTEITFHPGIINGGSYTAKVNTAGSISLLLQVALPCALFANTTSHLCLHGGTNAEMAPQIDYTTEIFKPHLEKFGASFSFDLKRRGYFPKGGGQILVNVEPVTELKPVTLLERGSVSNLYGWSFVAGTLPIKLAHQMADSAISILRSVSAEMEIERYKEERSRAPDNCSGIILVAETTSGCILGASALGKRNERIEETGKRAARDLLDAINSGACVDQHCQDQLIVLMALAKGQSRIRVGNITMHTKTAIYVVEKMTNVKFRVETDGGTNVIECTGTL